MDGKNFLDELMTALDGVPRDEMEVLIYDPATDALHEVESVAIDPDYPDRIWVEMGTQKE